MIKQVILSQCGIKFDAAALTRAGIDMSTILLAGPMPPIAGQVSDEEGVAGSPTSHGENGSGEGMIRKGKGKDNEDQDVLTPIHDQLSIQPLWWVLEFFPTKFRWQEPDGTWKSKWTYVFTNAATRPSAKTPLQDQLWPGSND